MQQTSEAPRQGATTSTSGMGDRVPFVAAMLVAGAFATVAFDLWGQAISPMLGLSRLSPDGLASSLLGTFGLPNSRAWGQFLHLLLVGLIAYPLGWMLIFEPLWTRTVGRGSWVLPSVLYGFGLWLFAIGGVTSVAGLPFFLTFTGITWIALIGHVLYGVALVWCLKRLGR